MLYILDQRLRAQNIPTDKAKKGNLARLTLICWLLTPETRQSFAMLVYLLNVTSEEKSEHC